MACEIRLPVYFFHTFIDAQKSKAAWKMFRCCNDDYLNESVKIKSKPTTQSEVIYVAAFLLPGGQRFIQFFKGFWKKMYPPRCIWKIKAAEKF